MHEMIKRFYNIKLYSRKQVRHFCDKGVITAEQYAEITGEEY